VVRIAEIEHGYCAKQQDRIFSIVAPCPISQISHAPHTTVTATIVSESTKSPIVAPTISFRIILKAILPLLTKQLNV
jgi:hypothetical protein